MTPLTPTEELRQLEDLVDQLVTIMQQSLESGEMFSDEFQGLLARNLEAGTERIQEIRQQLGQETPATPPPDAQLLWYLSGQREDAFLEYLKNYPSPSTQNLLRNPSELERVIQYLHASDPSQRPQEVNGIQQSELNSSTVWGTAYDPRTQKMKIRFNGGSEYEYDGIPINIYNAVISGSAEAKTDGQNQYGKWWKFKSPSVGAALNQYVKASGFPYRKIR